MSADKTDPRTLEVWLRSRIAEAAGLPSGEVGLDRELAELGIDSLRAAQVAAEIERRLGARFDASEIYDHPTIRRLAAYLSGGPDRASEERSRGQAAEPIAIVGMSCRFPGGGGLPGYWRLLASGGDAVSPGRGGDLEERLGRVWADVGTMGPGGYIEEVDLFDAEFFRIAPVEARLMDPQQRLLLETTWEALEWAGIDPEGLRGSRTGVYTGIASHDYWDLLAACGGEDSTSLYMATGASMSTAAGRIAFALGLEGPALAVDTASSSSLVAVHQAVTALQWGEADLALAGGVNVMLSPTLTEAFRTGGVLSPDGRCKTFDASANGIVRGEGCGVLVLKRLRDAEASRDRIWAVIRGSAVNQDGASAGLTVPSGPAQERVIEDALSQAGLAPSEVDYLEAHGTGTELGDPIEVRAAAAAYGAGRDPGRPLLLGSVKTSIGHLEAAAGVAGLIKTVLSVAHGMVPKHLHFRTPSPHVEWQRLPVRVASEGEAWPVREGRPPRAGVSSFGVSGTNAHVVVEGYGEASEPGGALLAAGPAVDVSWPEEVARPRPEGGEAPAILRGRRLLPLSGRTAEGLRALAGRYLEWLEERAQSTSEPAGGSPGPGGPEWLWDAAWTAAVGRSHHGHRAGLTFGGVGELREKLAELAGGEDAAGAESASAGGARVGFLFTGQGNQWSGMGRDLYESEPVFRAVLDRCEAEVRGLRGESLLEVMFEPGRGDELADTRWTQPALYALEAGLLELWRSVGVRPYAVLGHSVGEIAAAYAAGAFTLEAGARFAAVRGGLMGSVSEVGAMAAVFGAADWVSGLVAELNRDRAAVELSVAAYNGGHQVVSGAADAVAEALERCRSEGVRAERLRVSHAFHSGLMEPALDELEQAAADLQASPLRVPLASNVTGRMSAPGEALDGPYWRRHAREPVAFAAGVRALADAGVDVLVEVGPRPVLGPMALLAWPAAGEEAGEAAGSSGESPGMRPGRPLVLPTLRPPEQGVGAGGLAEAAAGAYEAGLSLRFEGLFVGEARRRVTLPSYPFQRRRYWVDAESGPRPADFLLSPEIAASAAGALEKHLEAEGLSLSEVAALAGDLERLSRGYAVAALDALGWPRERGEEVETEELRRRLEVVSDHAAVFGRVLELASAAGVLAPAEDAPHGSRWRVASAPQDGLADAALADPDGLAAALAERHPAGSIELSLLSRCGRSLAEVLRGRSAPLGLLFGEAAPGAAELYRESPWMRALSRLVAAVVGAAVSELPEGRRLRVLEVGAGTGGTTGWVLPALPEGRCDYAYTDVSAGFFVEARERFGSDGRLEYRTLDVERDPVEQGFAAHGYDVVVAANVLHATRDMGETLAHCRGLLSPGGLLVALEGLERQGWLDLTFGLLEGWWRFAEGADGYREDGPLMGAGGWRRALGDAGFGESAVVGEAEGAHLGVVVARGPAEVEAPAGSWGPALDAGRESAGRVRRAEAAPGASGTAPSDGLLERVRQAPAPEREDLLLGFVQRELRSVLGLPSLPAPGIGFFDIGMDSLMAMRLQARLNRALAGMYEAPSTVAFDHPSCELLARHLAEQLGVLDAPAPAAHWASATGGEEVAVVGMACRFPGAAGLAGFWRLLESGGDAITEGRVRPLEASAAAPWSEASAEGSIRWGGFIEGLDLFDAEFFRIAPVEARLLDPQQRLLLETSWEALESAGTDAARLKGSRTGVYAGISSHDYWDLLTAAGGEDALALYAATGASGSTAIGRVAFALGLEGPVLAVDTACSSSLVAVHQAVSALQRGETDLALAGGVHVMLSPAVTESFRRGGMLSPDGRCKTFDASANGYVRGEGCGVVVLKRLRDAEADGDPIWGVVRGSAINHDGASAGLTVPNGRAQERVIREALGRAGLEPQEVDYLEAHGTGTALGDPIEVNAAAAAYGAGRDPERPLRLGSVKSNVGHLEAAAGVAGLVKVLLSMAHGVIPRSLHFREPNPRVEWGRLPVQVVSEPEEWPLQEGRPARAGVSSFGFSGTNAHVVVEGYGASSEAPGGLAQAGRAVAVGWPEAVSEHRPEGGGGSDECGARERRVLALSGRTEGALRELAARYVEWLEESSGSSEAGEEDSGSSEKKWLADVAWTAGVGRSHLGRRAAMTFGDAGELREKLAALAAGSEAAGVALGSRAATESGGAPKVGFLFTGQGSQWVGMGRELYEREPVFRAVLDRCEAEVRELRGESLLAVMFGEGNGYAEGSLDDTRWTQPALYALEAGLWALWRSVGVRPAAVLGHSVGEIAAAYAAGVFTLEEGVRFAAQRGELMGSLPSSGAGSGAMAAVFGSAAEVEELVGEVNGELGREGLGLAAYNGVHQVVSGEVESVERLVERCGTAGVRAERLRVSHGFHSGLMEPVLDELEGLLSGVEARGGDEAALVSNVTGRVLGSGDRMDGLYWRRQAREPVAFGAGVAELAELGVEVLVELGPGPVLGRMAALAWPDKEGEEGAEASGSAARGTVEPVVVSSLWGRGRKAEESGSGRSGGGFEEAVAEAYGAGLEVGFAGMFVGEDRRRVSLPGYPFQRQRYWVEGGRRRRGGGAEHPLLGERRESVRGETTFETEVYATDPEWLWDHRVFGRVVAPGATYGSMASTAASLCAGPEHAAGRVTLTDMRFHVPLVLPEGAEPGRTVQVVLGAGDGSKQRPVEIYSSGEDEPGWTLHAEVWAGMEASASAGGIDLEALKEGLWERDVAGFYRWFAGAGVALGPSFRVIQSLWSGAGEVVGDVSLSAELSEPGVIVHPVLLDGCFQVLMQAMKERAEDRADGEGEATPSYLPFGWERLWLSGALPEQVTCRARLRESGSGAAAEVVSADLWLYGEDGAEVGGVSGLVLKRATRAALLAAGRGEELLHEVVWQPAPSGAEDGAVEGSVLLVNVGGGESRAAEALAAALAGRGVEVMQGWDGDPARLMESAGAVSGVVAAVPGRSGEEDLSLGALGWLLELVQGLLETEASLGLGLCVVTESGVLAEAGERVDPWAASVWGFGRSVQTEQPGLGLRLVDVSPGVVGDEDGWMAAAMETAAGAVLGGGEETQLAVRGGALLAPRLERVGLRTAGEGEGPLVRGDRSYLVTGGLGYLGLAMAERLAREGAGQVVLVGRRGPDEAVRERLAGLESETGCRLAAVPADVGDAEAVAGLLARFARSEREEGEWPRLAGIFHAAGVTDDGILTGQTAARFEGVFRAKAWGAWHLHRGTLDRELDLFVLYSSVYGILGPAGQSSYAAADGFLDGLAALRASAGLAGTSVAWGAWGGGGMAARDKAAATAAQMGLLPMTAERAHAGLWQVLRSGRVNGVVVDADWRRMGGFLGRRPLLSGLLPRAEAAAGASALLERLREARESEREGLLLEFVQREFQAVLQLPAPPEAGVGFFDLGMDSLMAVELRNRLNQGLGGSHVLSSTVVFDYATPEALAGHLARQLGVLAVAAEPARPAPVRRGREVVAIVGLACRFPGSSGLDGFWRLLEAGGDAITEGRTGGLPGQIESERARMGWGGYIEGVDLFDADFFRIAPVEARLLDPQQRLLLETSWQALECAAMDGRGLRGSRTGVYAGISTHDYWDWVVSGEDATSLYLATGNLGSAAIGRVAFALGLEGPTMAVDTACSASLVAVHQAVLALQRGDADLALAGGVNALLSPALTESFRSGGMLSPDGRCKTFDASANGYVRGEGCGMVVLKRLREAEADGDRIWGVVRGSAVNHDGASAGLTVPNGPAQERVIGEALARAGLEPREVDYLEAHGTGTELGDPIEVHAAAAAYGAGRDPAQPLLLGSVKTNVGHLEAAAGVAGLIKVLLSMAHGVIPKHLHFREPTPHVEWDRLPIRVVSEPEDWPPATGRPARAAVSSFAFSGTNAHVVVEAYGENGGSMRPGRAVAVGWPEAASGFRPEEESGSAGGERERRLLALSGRTEGALRELAGRYAEWLDEWLSSAVGSEGDSGSAVTEFLADMAWTAGVGRSHHEHRAGLTFGRVEELREKLGSLASGAGPVSAGRLTGGAPKVGFLFTGQGSQWAGMGRELYEREPVFRAVLDRCEAEIAGVRGESLLGVMFGEGAGSLDDTLWTQPALYALEAGLAALWASVGVRPVAVLGHSVGEIAAAYAAGVFTLEEGVRFAARRGELMGSLAAEGPGAGAMAAVFASAGAVEELVAEVNAGTGRGGLSVAAYNGVHQVVSGAAGGVEVLLKRCEDAGLRAERLRVSHGFHSVQMEPVLEELEGLLAGIEVKGAEVALASNVSGRVLGPGEVMDGAYWRRQARQPVAFAAGVAALADLGVEVLLELGPGPVLGGMAALAWPAAAEADGAGASSGSGIRAPVVLSSLEGKRSEKRDGGFVEAVAEAYVAGSGLSFAGLFVGEKRRRVALPGYAFQRQRYWVDAPRRRRDEADHPLLGERRESARGETTFETELYATEPDWLSEHRVFGRVVAPGAMYGSMALNAASLALGSGPGGAAEGVRLKDMQFYTPLLLPEGEREGEGRGRRVQVVSGPGDGSVEIYSKGWDEAGWTLHAEAWVGLDAAAGAWTDLESLGEGMSAQDVGELYRGLAAAGVELGPLCRAVRWVRSGVGEALGEVSVPLELKDRDVLLHPVLLDGFFHVMAAARKDEARAVWSVVKGDEEGSSPTYLPFGIERLWVRGEMPERVVCHARWREASAGAAGGEGEDGAPAEVATADLWFYGEDGVAVGAVSGLVMKRASRAAFLSGMVRSKDLLYALEWREAPRGAMAAEGPGESAQTGGLWVLALDEGREGLALARELAARNQRVVAAVHEVGAKVAPAEGSEVGLARLDTGSREEWRGLLERVSREGPLRGVVHLASLSGHGPGAAGEELAADQERVLGSGLALVQGLLDAGVEPGAGLWLVTRGGQVVAGERGGELSGAALWGFGKTVWWEAGGLNPRLVDLDPDEGSGFDALAEELLSPDREREVAYRGGTRLALRMVRGTDAGAGKTEGTERLRKDGTYLVTGGLGGIGLEVAGWLADRGVRKIVLNGRREPDGAARAAVEALRGRGAEVRVELADVTDGAAVAAMIERVEGRWGSLAGVFHSVGVLSDGSVSNQDWSGFERVLWPKVLGAWHLHRATAGRDLDLFVLFSSVAGVLGSPGQANYAAANAFLDQLARRRRAVGLAGQSVAWGVWSGVGEAEEQRERIGKRVEAMGIGWMTPGQGLEALDRVVRGGQTTTLAALMDWGAHGAGVHEAPALLEDLLAPAVVVGDREWRPDLLERLRGARASGREELLLGFVREELQAVLRSPSLPALGIGFFDLGMDSLMAVELRNRLNRGLAGEYVLPPTVMFDHLNPEALARHLAKELGVLGEGPAGSRTETQVSPADAAEGEKERVRGLSDQEFLEEALSALGETDE